MYQGCEEIRVVIIEDESSWCTIISATLNSFGYTIAGIASDFEAAVRLLDMAEYDVVLLDVGLGGQNSGIELGRMLHQKYNKPFVYITGNAATHTTNQILQTFPAAYLLKPIQPTALVTAVQGALRAYTNVPATRTDEDMLFVKQGNRYKRVDWKNVAYLSSDKKYTAIFNTIDKSEYYIRSSLSNTLKYLIPDHLKSSFIQVNRAEAVGISYIHEVRGHEVVTSFKTFPLTEAYSAQLRKVLRVIT
jgi:DNA-binding LytR/AlgR family response regulator